MQIESHNENPRVLDKYQTLALWKSGFINRWHNNEDWRLRMSGDMNGGHTSRVAILYLGLFWYERNVAEDLSHLVHNLVVSLLHDAPERISGDIPQPGKMQVPELRSGDKAAEWAYWEGLGLSNYSKKSEEIGLCDLLDAIMFARSRAPERVDNQTDWCADKHTCLQMAENFGLTQDVDWLIRNV